MVRGASGPLAPLPLVAVSGFPALLSRPRTQGCPPVSLAGLAPPHVERWAEPALGWESASGSPTQGLSDVRPGLGLSGSNHRSGRLSHHIGTWACDITALCAWPLCGPVAATPPGYVGLLGSMGSSCPIFFSLEGNGCPADRVLGGGFSWKADWWRRPLHAALALGTMRVARVPLTGPRSSPSMHNMHPDPEGNALSFTHPAVSTHVTRGSRVARGSQVWLMPVERRVPELGVCRDTAEAWCLAVRAGRASGGTVCGRGAVSLGIAHGIDPALGATLSCGSGPLAAGSSIEG